MDTKGLMFPKPKDQGKSENKEASTGKRLKRISSKRAKACDISATVKAKVFKRDNCKCIICGQSGIPNSHYIKRSHGGLGIEQNVVCMCISCHNAYDNGKDTKKTKIIQEKTKSYLKGKYGSNWHEENLIYKKGM